MNKNVQIKATLLCLDIGLYVDKSAYIRSNYVYNMYECTICTGV